MNSTSALIENLKLNLILEQKHPGSVRVSPETAKSLLRIQENQIPRDIKDAPENKIILGIDRFGMVCSVIYRSEVRTFYTKVGNKIWDCVAWVPHPVFDGIEFNED